MCANEDPKKINKEKSTSACVCAMVTSEKRQKLFGWNEKKWKNDEFKENYELLIFEFLKFEFRIF